jgi:hypothetical protein
MSTLAVFLFLVCMYTHLNRSAVRVWWILAKNHKSMLRCHIVPCLASSCLERLTSWEHGERNSVWKEEDAGTPAVRVDLVYCEQPGVRGSAVKLRGETKCIFIQPRAILYFQSEAGLSPSIYRSNSSRLSIRSRVVSKSVSMFKH